MSPIHIKRLFNAIIVVAGAAAAATTAPFAFLMQCHARAFNRGGEHRRLKHVQKGVKKITCPDDHMLRNPIYSILQQVRAEFILYRRLPN